LSLTSFSLTVTSTVCRFPPPSLAINVRTYSSLFSLSSNTLFWFVITPVVLSTANLIWK
jgi:hypothetical protein